MLILYLSLREGQTYNVVIIAKRIHLFPYRTQKLSSIAPKVVGGSLPARIGRRDAHGRLAQLGEHLPYKQGVTGSSPVGPILLWVVSRVAKGDRL